jgi:uncharacterized membrane protein
MKGIASHFAAHPRLLVAALIGIAAAPLAPNVDSVVTRGLIGWNVGVWLYLLSIGLMMWRADRGHLQRAAVRQSEGAVAVLAIFIAGAVVSIGAIVFELSTAKQTGAPPGLAHLLLVAGTIAGSWLLLPTLFSLNYASLYYGRKPCKGLHFPGDDKSFEPDYADFIYYAFTIAVALQTADVSITSRAMRRLTLTQSLLAFLFNTAVLAFSINIAASLF